ncbi:caspase-2-like [Styela clava]
MDRLSKKILQKNRLLLARSLDISELLQYLVQEGILSDRMVEKIESKCTTFGKNVAFLNILPTRGPLAFEKLVTGLKETQQDYLAEALQFDEGPRDENSNLLEGRDRTDTKFHAKENILTSMENPIDSHDGPSNLLVEKSTLEFYRGNYNRGYKMTSRPRGYALIINVTEFDNGVDLPQRQGGNLDKENLGSVLHHLGFETLLVENRTASEISSSLETFARNENHKSRDACVVALLTHGQEGVVYGRDGKTLVIEDIISLFDNANCPNLRNKPKIFFVQACRGDLYDRGIDEIDGGAKIRKSRCTTSTFDYSFDEPRLPTRSDMLFGYATQRGQAAMRNTHHGSWYIEALVKVLAKNAKNHDLAEMLTSVNSVIKGMQCHSPGSDLHNCKEMPIFHSTLCKKLYLFPGIFQNKK